jgi:hypothetical protein
METSSYNTSEAYRLADLWSRKGTDMLGLPDDLRTLAADACADILALSDYEMMELALRWSEEGETYGVGGKFMKLNEIYRSALKGAPNVYKDIEACEGYALQEVRIATSSILYRREFAKRNSYDTSVQSWDLAQPFRKGYMLAGQVTRHYLYAQNQHNIS